MKKIIFETETNLLTLSLVDKVSEYHIGWKTVLRSFLENKSSIDLSLQAPKQEVLEFLEKLK